MDVLDEKLRERRPQDHAINPAIHHAVDLRQFIAACSFSISAARHRTGMNTPQGDRNMVRRRERVVDARQDLRPEEIEWGHHHADHSCLSRLNALDQQVRAIFEPFGRLQYPLAGLVGVPSRPDKTSDTVDCDTPACSAIRFWLTWNRNLFILALSNIYELN